MPSRPALPHAVALYACDAAEKTARPQRGTNVQASGAASSPRAPPRPRAETGFTRSRIVQLEARADPEPGSAGFPTTRLGDHKGESYGLLSDPTLGGPSRSREMPAELVFFSWCGTHPDLDPDPDPDPDSNPNPSLTVTLSPRPSLTLTRWNEEMHIPDELTPSGFGMVGGLGSGLELGCY